MNGKDLRPPVWVGHVVLETDRLEESAAFMRAIGMRTVHPGPNVTVATHRHFTSLGFAPTPIEAVPKIDHELFRVREPAGHLITFYSNHVSGDPV
jgi:catechol 2,3-dioxygenase-like lactoylglutathione lyase family enzyme